jgi:hypothetical protein
MPTSQFPGAKLDVIYRVYAIQDWLDFRFVAGDDVIRNQRFVEVCK